MEIRLLGPIEIADGNGRATRLGYGEAALLAVLALRAGRVVPSEHLIDALWGEELPANPANALQLRVSKLRKALAAAGSDGELVVTRAPGYLLDLSPAAVDVLRVRDEVVRARGLARDGDTVSAVDLLSDALAAWRGPALVEFEGAPWAVAEAQQLDELRLAATEKRIELELELGRHEHVIPDLETLVRNHPLRERLHGLTMLALYRSGRQVDALAAFQTLRASMAEQLGLDPSPELRELEAAILRQDGTLDAPRVDALGRVSELPERLDSVVGREAEIRELTMLVGAHRLVTVTGPGGTGKTTLAVEVARAMSCRFPDGVVFVSLQSVAVGQSITASIAAACGFVHTQAGAGQSADARLARQLGRRRTLLVLDNSEHVIDHAATTVQRLLTRCPNLVVLATSREALATPGEVQYVLHPLPTPDPGEPSHDLRSAPAVRLFVQRARAVDRAFAPDPDQLATIASVCRQLDGMPLAIELAAATVRSVALPDLLARLDSRFMLLDSGPRTAEARQRTLAATIDWSHDLLTDRERIAFRRLSVLRGSWTLEDAEAVCGFGSLDQADVLELVGRLVAQSLISAVDRDGRFRTLETIRRYGEERLVAAAEHDAAMGRSAERLLALAEVADRQLRGPDQVTWLRRLDERRDDIRAALTYCRREADRHGETGLRLATALGWFWYLSDHEEGRRQLHSLLAIVGDHAPEARGRALQAIAAVGRPGACLVHPSATCAAAAAGSITLLQEAGDDEAAARSRILLAVEGVRGGDPEPALAELQAALDALPHDRWHAALGALVRMEILVRHGRDAEGLAHGDLAAERFERLGDRWGVSAVRGHQGFNLRAIGELEGALTAYEESYAVAQEGRLHNSIQMLAGEIALVRLALGRTDAALDALAEGEAAARRYGYVGGLGLAHVGRGFANRLAADLTAADAEFAAGIEILDEGASLPYLAWGTSGAGHVRELLGDLEGAQRCHERVLRIARELADPWLTALGMEGLAGTVVHHDPRRAARLLGTARRIRQARRRPASPLEALDLDRVSAATEAALGPARSGRDAGLCGGAPEPEGRHPVPAHTAVRS